MAMFFKGQKEKVRVEATVDLDDNEKAVFYLFFKPLTVSAQSKLQQMNEKESISVSVGMLKDYIVGWDEVYDANEKPVKFTAKNLGDMLDVPAYFAAAVTAMINSAVETTEKN